MEILRQLIDFKNADAKEITYDKIYSDPSGQKYLSPFDLNALDVNDQSGLYSAVQGNRNQVCEFLLNLKLKKLTDKEILRHEETVRRQNARIPTENSSLFNLSSILSSNQPTNSQQPSISTSFFNQLKNVLLENTTKTYDSYVINYTKSNAFQDYHKETLFDHDQLVEETENEAKDVDQNSAERNNQDIYLNPINLNQYSKFGTTCLNEAIKNRNLPLVQLLISKGANVNLPIYESQSQSSENASNSTSIIVNSTPTTPPKIISNCLCETLKYQDEAIFAYLVDFFHFNDESFRLTLRFCKEHLLQAAHAKTSFAKKVIAFLLKSKIVHDSEYKVNLKNKLSARLLAIFQTTNNENSSSSSSSQSSVDSGLILNWNGLDPKLDKLYESWLLNATKYSKFPTKMNMEPVAGTPLTTPQSEDLNLNSTRDETNLLINVKKLHLHTITRVDLSNNCLEQLPFALFQIETLRYLKLSDNRLKKLPTGKNKDLDDVNILLINNENLYWTCNQLEEIDLDNNQLHELPAQLFLIKSLKHLNVSSNCLEALPIEMWQAPTLFDMNASFNRLSYLPIVNCDYFFYKENMSKNSRSRAYTNPAASQQSISSGRMTRRDEARQRTRTVQDHPLNSNSASGNKIIKALPNSTSQNLIVSHKEKPVFKANIWHKHSINMSGKYLKK